MSNDAVPAHRCRINKKPIVYFQVNFINVPSIDTVAQTWSCEFTLRGWTSGLKGARCWTHVDEPPADFKSPLWLDDTYTRPLQLDDWEPRLRIANLIVADQWKQNAKWMTSAKEELEFKWRVQGTFLEQLEIGAFPRDIQALQIKITSTTPQFVIDREAKGGELDGKPVDEAALVGLLDELARLERRAVEVDLNQPAPLSDAEMSRRGTLLKWRSGDDRVRRKIRLAPHYEVTREDDALWEQNGLSDADKKDIHDHVSVVQTANFGMSNVWTMCEHVRMRTYHTVSTESGGGAIKPVLNISLLAMRRPEYYLMNIEVPMFVLTSLTGLTWAIGPNDVADRLSVSLTLVLTAVAYKLTVAESIPQVAYLTLLDKFVSLCFLFMTLAAVENAVAPTFDPSVTDPPALASFDAIAGFVWGGLWLLTCMWYVLSVRQLHGKRAHALRTYTMSSHTGVRKVKGKILPVDGHS